MISRFFYSVDEESADFVSDVCLQSPGFKVSNNKENLGNNTSIIFIGISRSFTKKFLGTFYLNFEEL